MEERTARGLHGFLVPYIESVPRETPVLDVGCGTGAWLARLHRMGFQDLTGVDIDPPALEFARVLRADLDRERPKLEARYGLVTSFEVLEHLENVGGLLAAVSDALEPDGFAILTTPNIHSLRARVRFALTGRLPSFDEKGEPTHITPIWLPALEKVAARYGLEVSRVWTYPERGTIVFGRPVRVLAAIARVALPDPLPGDSICVMLRRAGQVTTA